MTADLTTKLHSWLANEGFPFELRVGRAFQDAQWDVFHSQHYSDPETGKLREIDVHASFGPYVGDSTGMGMVSVSLVCECKVSQGRPWVIFTSGQSDDGHRLVGHLTPGEPASRAMSHAIRANRRAFSSLVAGPRIGHGLTKAFSDSRAGDPTGPYSAVMQALTAATALSHHHDSSMFQPGGKTTWISLYLPVVVLQGQLYEFYLDKAGNEVLTECSRAHVLVHPSSNDAMPVLVQIVTARELQAFAITAHAEAVSIAQTTLPEAKSICDHYRNSPPSRHPR